MKHKSASIQPDLFEQEEPRAYGLLASAGCKTNVARARELMAAPIQRSIRRQRTTQPIRTPRPIIARRALAAAAA